MGVYNIRRKRKAVNKELESDGLAAAPPPGAIHRSWPHLASVLIVAGAEAHENRQRSAALGLSGQGTGRLALVNQGKPQRKRVTHGGRDCAADAPGLVK